ncbi:glutathione synthase [Permianibacter aggregans]|uniref:Glutathione synthetase n=1 Tax=Permianibacter aggregans TaxID=1510150 RepID=A0A4R6UTH0_9GAMM|nr:glutathione synthase [Permianibacter aggregans]QGX40029.1 glutathione synthase [Permianibacter aggregans]TDQ49159.1 glutathione synthase [Permianibacter aggregans]
MPRQLAMVMDPIDLITPYKDTSFALLLAAQARGERLQVLTQGDLYLRDGKVFGRAIEVRVHDRDQVWFEAIGDSDGELSRFDYLLMRKDPPFDQEFLYSTYLLELAAAQGLRVINDPRSIRDCNEKLFAAWFPSLTPTTLVTRDIKRLRAFLLELQHIVVKPLDGMGGRGVFVLKVGDPNITGILETLTNGGTQMIMAQRYLPEIADGDKRILILNGQVIDHCLARIPLAGESRGNLAAGGRGIVQPLSKRDQELAEQIAPELMKRGLRFVGLDVIGDYVTEINVTSPTCLREIAKATGRDLAGEFLAGLW